jgi:hypothetical protein
MAERTVGVTDTAPGTGVAEVSTHERSSPDITTPSTNDPGAAGTTLTVTSAAKFPATNNYKIRVENEVMLVTAGAGTTSWTVTRAQDGTTGVAHAIGSTVAQVVALQRVVPTSQRAVSYVGSAVTFRTLGNAASPQNIFSIENGASSSVLIAVRQLTMEQDATAVLTALTNQFKTSRPTALPTGGTALSKGSFDTALTSSASVILRGATASDGGAATAITATAGAGTLWCNFAFRLHTAVGQVLDVANEILPNMVAVYDPIILRAGQALLVQVVNPTAASNAATNHYVVKCMWEEFAIP